MVFYSLVCSFFAQTDLRNGVCGEENKRKPLFVESDMDDRSRGIVGM